MKAERIQPKVDLYNVIKRLLTAGTLSVTFTKKDGEERIMKCTTRPVDIPKDKQPIGENKAIENTEVVRAFDVENNGWRSFRVDSVKSFSLVSE